MWPCMSKADVFAALGDSIRLELVDRLSAGQSLAIVQLTDGLRVTRQAVTKHLRVLREAGLVSSRRVGRENRFQLRPGPLISASDYLAKASAQWDESIRRLREHVEK